jgi:hypothetical protein
MTEETKSCPLCGEKVLAVAKKCKHCGSMIEEHLNSERQHIAGSDDIPTWVLPVVIIGPIVAFFIWAGWGDSDDVTATIAASQPQPATTDQEILDQIWRGFENDGNKTPDIHYLDIKGRILKRGTVPPSVINSSAKGRLPAYLACYDYVQVLDGAGDLEANICVYYVGNPTRGTNGVMFRGGQHFNQLEEQMSSDGFTSN